MRVRPHSRVVAALATTVCLTLSLDGALAEDKAVGTITYVSGEALRANKAAGAWSSLKKDAKLYQGDRLKTKAGGRLEATLADGSQLRLAENSELNLEQASVSRKKQGKKQVTAKLVLGRVWAGVTSLFGDESKFEVVTDNAVAGVRGTQFAATRDAAGETTIKVYSGRVLVSNKPIYAIEGHTKATRHEVAGPQEISKKQWEEMVASAMQMVRVAAGGTISAAEGFALADPAADDWEKWNSERDKLAGLGGEK